MGLLGYFDPPVCLQGIGSLSADFRGSYLGSIASRPCSRKYDRMSPEKSPLHCQFHLSTLLICTMVSGVAFALIGRFGLAGTMERIGVAVSIGTIFLPIVEFCYWWKENGYDDPC